MIYESRLSRAYNKIRQELGDYFWLAGVIFYTVCKSLSQHVQGSELDRMQREIQSHDTEQLGRDIQKLSDIYRGEAILRRSFPRK